MERRTIRRGDIYYAQLDPVVGSEQGGTRPVMIVSNDRGNRFGPTVIVAPITSRKNRGNLLPTHMRIPHIVGLRKDSIILFEQVRAVDKERLHEYVGTLSRRFVSSVDSALLASIGVKRTEYS
ncbi:type II toxin-antitoxin system PemK/MazF family toxin [Butyricicoccus sp.]|uniref:type II toxin-antitoxin system PemK/MazF family toxin n=1 Tax=Butyricicoccus sp. TaxID=2049021 RepID=UPI003F16631E